MATEDVTWAARYGRLVIRVVYLTPRVADLWSLRLSGFHSSLLPSPILCYPRLLVVTVCHIARPGVVCFTLRQCHEWP
ncbi:hypothetical protein CDEST_08129 [Colletotrichum destructivum]|uniref:Uncharacterized protein n=1 Tax=Colletotrichum destructivum TaxID=34406 RepID=A0AAX4IJB1_9PEZI|nr:hypothetical protein CDEST_08129 [Colletotrichum destructivum]